MDREVKFRVTGLTALLMHNPAGMGGGRVTKVGPKMIPTPEEEAATSVYKDENGNYRLPSVGFRNALILAGSGQKAGKRSAKAVISGAVFNVDEWTPIFLPGTKKPIKTHEVDTRRAVVQKQGILRSRAKIPHWEAVVTFNVDTDFVSEKIVLDLFQLAGKIIGVGDYRPAKTGPFGRFAVEIAE